MRQKDFNCSIPIPAPVLNYSLLNNNNPGDDFYFYINSEWLNKTSLPPFENDFGISEEVERCIYKKSKDILSLTKHPLLSQLRKSCLTSRSQQKSVEFLKQILSTLQCIRSKEDIITHFATLSSHRFNSILNFQYNIHKDKIFLLIDGNVPGISLYSYKDESILSKYKSLLHKIGKEVDIPIEKSLDLEIKLSFELEDLYSEDGIKTTGLGLCHTFPNFPWKEWFETHGILNWKTMNLYYKSPRWIRYISKMLEEVSLEEWKCYLARCYCLNAISFLPPPYDELDYEFFGKVLQGQKIKTPQMELFIKIVYDYCGDIFSEIFWNELGSDKMWKEAKEFMKSIINSAKKRYSTLSWLSQGARVAGVEKISKVKQEIIRPLTWKHQKHIELDDTCLLKNIFLLGKNSHDKMISFLGKKYSMWEEGIFRVNAYYYNESNQIIIPFGTCLSPFYSLDVAWNYGALGSLIAHELCHGFDEDGRLFNADGEKKKWWSSLDLSNYHRKTKKLVELYSNQKIDGKEVNGEKTLNENIADLGGVSISLHALKESQLKRNLDDKQKLEEFRRFFTAYATSWRTLYRKEKLERMLEIDVHSPAELRVNLIVSQFQEWYDAFQIPSFSKLYIEPKDRIEIF